MAKYLKKKIIINKLRFLLLIFLLISIILFVIIFKIKYVDGDKYEKKAIEQQINHGGVDRILNPNRGSILDRNGQALAVSSTVYNVIFDIRNLVKEIKKDEKSKNKVINSLKITSEILEIPLKTLESYLEVDKETNKPLIDKNYYIISKKVEKDKAKKLIDKIYTKNIWLEDDTKRTYLHNSKASQLVGFIRGDNSSWGIERYYNKYLLGTTGRLFRLYNESNYPTTEIIEAEEGYTLVTTIDSTIQQFATDISEKYGKLYNAENACIIVMVPKTGEILAMGEYPTFNSSDPFNIDYINSDNLKNTIKNAEEDEKTKKFFNIWRSFIVSDTFEPGSIFKPIVVAAALEENIISPTDNFFCSGSVNILDRKIRCVNRSGHNNQSLTETLANSCNMSVIEIAEKLGREKFYEYQKNFGIGELTEIDTYGETSASNLVYNVKKLNPVELATSAIGQGFNVTPIQAINSFNTVINGGNLMKPYIVSQILDSKGNIVKENLPTIQRKVISQSTSDFLKKALVSVVNGTGTGRKAHINGYLIGGKTGTAQQGNRDDKKYTLSFLSYFPAENPEYVAIGVLHKPEYKPGVTSAVPMLREMFVNLIKYKSIAPSNDKEEVDLSIDNNNFTVPNYIGKDISQVVYDLNRKNINYDIIGKGDTVIKQTPFNGTKISKKGKIFLYIAEENKKETRLIPDVVGMTKEQAIKALELCNLKVLTEEKITKNNEELNKTENNKVDNKDLNKTENNKVDNKDLNKTENNKDLNKTENNKVKTKEIENNTVENKENYEKIVTHQMPSSGILIEKDTEIKIILE